MKRFGKLIGALAMAGIIASSATPAMAQRWHGGGGWHGGGWHGGGFRGGGWGGYRHGDRTGLAIGAGLLGLGVGAAIASSANRDRYYGGYPGYYGRPGYYGYRAYRYEDCVVQPRWDPYVGDYVPVRTCY